MRTLLVILDVLEFLTSPIGVMTSLWMSLYFFLVNVLNYDVALAAVIPMIPATDLYLWLKRSGY
jgi:hypothetical protein